MNYRVVHAWSADDFGYDAATGPYLRLAVGDCVFDDGSTPAGGPACGWSSPSNDDEKDDDNDAIAASDNGMTPAQADATRTGSGGLQIVLELARMGRRRPAMLC